MADALPALRGSVGRLRSIIEAIDESRLVSSAYPSEWTVADVLSHLGSGAVIGRRRAEDVLAGRELPADFAPSVWDEWNAKPPGTQAADALVADQAYLDRLTAVTDDERARFRVAIGPMDLDFAGLVAMRLNEHAVHTWDVDVALRPDATIPPDAAAVVVDNLEQVARFSAKPSGAERTVRVRTFEPARDFTVSLGAESVTLSPTTDGDPPDLELPAEALIRLVYGRLDADHTGPVKGDEAVLDLLRATFRGF